MEKIIGRFVDDRKAQRLKEKSLPLEACAVVAGHTYKRVKFVHFVNLNSLTHLSSYLAVLCDCMSWLASVFGLPGFLHFLCFLFNGPRKGFDWTSHPHFNLSFKILLSQELLEVTYQVSTCLL